MFIERTLHFTDSRPEGAGYIDLILALLFEGCLLKPIAEDPRTTKYSNLSSLDAVTCTLSTINTCVNDTDGFSRFNDGPRKDYYVSIMSSYSYHIKDYVKVRDYVNQLYNLFRVEENDYAFFGAVPPNMQARLLEVGVKANPYTHLYWMDNVKKYLHGQEGYDLILRRTFEATLYN